MAGGVGVWRVQAWVEGGVDGVGVLQMVCECLRTFDSLCIIYFVCWGAKREGSLTQSS